MANPRLCSLPDCDKPAFRGTRKYCCGHYVRWQRHGDPYAGRTPMGVPLQFLTDVVLPYMGDDCLTWPYAKINGYGCIASGRSKAHSVSRLVCAHVWGPPPSANHQAAHKCGKGHEGCVNPLHLEWKTPSENNRDKVAHGTAQRGERCNNSKLTELDVREIREMRKTLPERLVAEQFGLNRRTVNSIVRRQSWQHID